jgi:hypothetical protein
MILSQKLFADLRASRARDEYAGEKPELAHSPPQCELYATEHVAWCGCTARPFVTRVLFQYAHIGACSDQEVTGSPSLATCYSLCVSRHARSGLAALEAES